MVQSPQRTDDVPTAIAPFGLAEVAPDAFDVLQPFAGSEPTGVLERGHREVDTAERGSGKARGCRGEDLAGAAAQVEPAPSAAETVVAQAFRELRAHLGVTKVPLGERERLVHLPQGE